MDSGLESLVRIEAWLRNGGFTTSLELEYGQARSHDPVALCTTTVWRLTWSRKTTHGLARCGSLTVAAGEDALPTLPTSM